MDIEAKVRELVDRQEILDCMHRYTRGIDRHDTEVVLSAYHPDAFDDHGLFAGLPPAFVEWANNSHAERYTAHQHFVSNYVLDHDGDEAHTESYWVVYLRRADGQGVDTAGGRYVDRLQRRDDTWRIAERVCVFEWGGFIAPGDPTAAGPFFVNGTWDRTDVSYQRPLTHRSSAAVTQPLP